MENKSLGVISEKLVTPLSNLIDNGSPSHPPLTKEQIKVNEDNKKPQDPSHPRRDRE